MTAYNTDKMDSEIVTELPGLAARQTLPTLPTHPRLREARVSCPVPSTLFGPNVVEVWRVLWDPLQY